MDSANATTPPNARPATDAWSLAAAIFALLCLTVMTLGPILSAVFFRSGERGPQAKTAAARADIQNFSTALDSFDADCGRYPTATEGLDVLVNRPPGLDNWRGPYLSKVPLDPWGNPYSYVYPGLHNPKSFDLRSLGPDRNGKAGGEGKEDINNWTDSAAHAGQLGQIPTELLIIGSVNAVCWVLLLGQAWRNWRSGPTERRRNGLLALLWLPATVPAIFLYFPDSAGPIATLLGFFGLIAWWPPARVLAIRGLHGDSRLDRMCARLALAFAVLLILTFLCLILFSHF